VNRVSCGNCASGRRVTFREGSVVFHDLADLRILAEYHSGYLA
jgi:hypothetical protein